MKQLIVLLGVAVIALTSTNWTQLKDSAGSFRDSVLPCVFTCAKGESSTTIFSGADASVKVKWSDSYVRTSWFVYQHGTFWAM